MSVGLRSKAEERALRRQAAARAKQLEATRAELVRRALGGYRRAGQPLPEAPGPEWDPLDRGGAAPDPREWYCLQGLGLARLGTGRREQAVAILEEALALCIADKGPDYPEVGVTQINLAIAYWDLDRLEEAYATAHGALGRLQASLGEAELRTIQTRIVLGGVCTGTGRLAEAEEHFSAGLDGALQRAAGDDVEPWLRFLLAMALRRQEREEAEAALREAWSTLRRAPGADHWKTLRCADRLGELLLEQGRLEEAEIVFRETVLRRRAHGGAPTRGFLGSLEHLALAVFGQGRLAEAEPLARELALATPERSARYAVRAQLLDSVSRAACEPGSRGDR